MHRFNNLVLVLFLFMVVADSRSYSKEIEKIINPGIGNNFTKNLNNLTHKKTVVASNVTGKSTSETVRKIELMNVTASYDQQHQQDGAFATQSTYEPSNRDNDEPEVGTSVIETIPDLNDYLEFEYIDKDAYLEEKHVSQPQQIKKNNEPTRTTEGVTENNDYETYMEQMAVTQPHHYHHKLPPRLFHLEHLLLSDEYDKYHAADWLSGKVADIWISIYIQSVSEFKENDMSFDVDVYLRKTWRDPRLSHNFKRHQIVNEPYLIEQMWKPDLYFSNAKESNINAVTKPNQMIKIFPDGMVLHSLRIVSKISCHLALHAYPVDSQECDLKLLSYSHPIEELKLHWTSAEPLNYDQEILMAAMTLEKMEHGECNETYGNDTFSCLKASIFVRRQIGAHMIQTYVPSFIIVVISWASFWIDPYAVPARVTLSFTTLLTLTTQAAGVRMRLPTVSYAQALDYWMGLCTLMVFGALLEYTAVNSLLQKAGRAKQKEQRRKIEEPLLNNSFFKDFPETKSTLRRNNSFDDSLTVLHKERFYVRRAYLIEKISRIAFPGVFFAVNVVYWFLLLSS